MPQLGETVTEGTITRWLKQVGDPVAVDEPLFEVSTDKVDSEVPSPVAGTLTEVLVAEGDTVEVGARLAVIGDAAAAGTDGDGAAPAPAPPVAAPAPAPAAAAPAPAPPAPAPAVPAPPAPAPPAPPAPAAAPVDAAVSADVTSPVVRRLIAERGLDPAGIVGTGAGGRITRADVEAAAAAPAPGAGAAPVGPPAAPTRRAPATGDERIPFDNIRRRTAEHMVASKATSAHVYTSVEVDYDRVERARRAHQAEWRAQEGFSLTYLPFIVRAFCDAVRDYPNVNASVDGDTLVVHHDVNLGIAVDKDFQGLIAPVIRAADGKRLRLVAREVRDLATRARSKQLGPDEILGGTFTITNMGPFGTYMTLPIINQPQVAILATDSIRKRPVVVEGPGGDDAIAVHPVGVLALAWDHRAFDGAYAASFLHAVREILESRDWEAELA
jgi:2-oxoglutarate dehydrogenase E2 component (dihydrolipoamide succinyltransferase)